MNKIQKIVIGTILFVVVVALLVGLGMQNMSVVKATSEGAKDITALTEEEQKEIETKILQDWGTPEYKKFKALKNDFAESDLETSGDAWYYLTQNISTSSTAFYKKLNINKGNVRIVLNGYSISGNFKLRAAGLSSTVSIFDKIPSKDGIEYTYNPNPIKYYQYNSKLKAYTDYSTTAPLGEDVTNMPTWQVGTYIKVIGSAFSSNELNTGISTCYLSTTSGKLNMYGINVVGCRGNNLMLYATGDNTRGAINLYQCNFLGNYGKNGCGVIFSSFKSTITLKGCNIYGNQDDGRQSYAGIQPSNTKIPGKECDISIRTGLDTSNKVVMYKSNVGAIASIYYYSEGRSISYDKAVYVKDVDFGREVSVMDYNVATFFEKISGIRGTIELVFGNKLNYDGNSPNLNFIVHGGDIDTEFKKGYNALTVGETGNVGNIITVFGPVNKEIKINGTAAGVSSSGDVTIGSNGNITLQSEQKIGGTLINNGSFIIQSGNNIADSFTNNGDFIIQSGKSIASSFTNNGDFTMLFGQTFGKNITGTWTNNGTFIIKVEEGYKLESETSIGESIINKGKLIIQGTVNRPIHTIK